MKSVIARVLCGLVVSLWVVQASAAPILVATQSHPTTPSATNNLLQLDLGTGAASVIGPLNHVGVTGLGYDPNHGVLYGISGQGAQDLMTVDPASGNATVVAGTFLPAMQSVEYDSTTDTLYGLAAGPSQGLYELDPTTGIGTFIGTTQFPMLGSAYDSANDIMYASGPLGLYTMDLTTAAITFVGSYNTGDAFGIGALAFDPSVGLYGVATNNKLYSIDTSTAQATLIGETGLQENLLTQGLAFVPEPGTAGLLLAGAALLARRRHRGGRATT